MATATENIEKSKPACAKLSLRETAERALARQAEMEDIRRELLALAQKDDVLRKLIYENRQKHFALAQRMLELTIR
jgi:hypothetical protein